MTEKVVYVQDRDDGMCIQVIKRDDVYFMCLTDMETGAGRIIAGAIKFPHAKDPIVMGEDEMAKFFNFSD